MKQDPPPPPGSPLPTLTTLLIGRTKRGIILDDTLALTCGGNQVNELYTFRYERTKYEGQGDNKENEIFNEGHGPKSYVVSHVCMLVLNLADWKASTPTCETKLAHARTKRGDPLLPLQVSMMEAGRGAEGKICWLAGSRARG